MIDEREEFLIAQLADDSIDAAERARVESLVRTNAAARKLFDDYRRLDAMIVDVASPGDRESAAILDSVYEQLDAMHSARWRISPVFYRPVAAAALLLLGVWIGTSLNRPDAPRTVRGGGTLAVAVSPTASTAGQISVAVGQPTLTPTEYARLHAEPPAAGRVWIAPAGEVRPMSFD